MTLQAAPLVLEKTIKITIQCFHTRLFSVDRKGERTVKQYFAVCELVFPAQRAELRRIALALCRGGVDRRRAAGKGGAKKDRAVILSLQDEGTVYAIWACMRVGVFTLILPPLDKGKLNRFVAVLKSCAPKFLISNKALEQTSEHNPSGMLLRQAFFQVVSLKRIYTDQIKPCDAPVPLCTHQASDMLYLQYTSGSTSAPKGVMVTYGNLMGCIDLCMCIFDFKHTQQSLVSWVPFYRNIGLMVAIFMPAYADHAVAHYVPTLQFLESPLVWLKALSQYQATITAAPNSAYELCVKLVAPEDAAAYDLSHMQRLINGPETVDRFCKLFELSHDTFAPGYGLSECVCGHFVQPGLPQRRHLPGSIPAGPLSAGSQRGKNHRKPGPPGGGYAGGGGADRRLPLPGGGDRGDLPAGRQRLRRLLEKPGGEPGL